MDLPIKEQPNKKKRQLSNKHREWLNGYAFISLWLIGLIALTIIPLGKAFWYSLNDANFYGNTIKTAFQWFANFKYAFTEDTIFPTIVVNYLMEIVVEVPFSIVASLIIAMLLNQKIRCRGLFRVIFFLPVIISTGPVISELLLQGATEIPLLSGEFIEEFLVSYLPKFIAQPISLLFDKLVIVLWLSGIQILIFLSGLQRINKQVYEAASIDGASGWQTFWKITLPSMKPFILLNVVYTIVTLSFFDMPVTTGEYTILTYIEKHSFGSKGFGYACSLGIIYFLLILVHIGIYALILKEKKVKK